MPEITLRAHTDTWVGEESPNQNHGGGAKMRVRGSGSGNQRRSLIFFPLPFKRGATIVSATLRVYARQDWGAGSRVLTAKRIQDSWKENRVTWANQPSSTDTNSASQTVGSLADEEEVAFDVTEMLQDVSDGGSYHGFRLIMDTDEPRSFYSSDHPKEGSRPKLDLEWGQAPYPPSNLHPSSGDAVSRPDPRLSWRFTDHRGDTEQGWSQVQISLTSSFGGALEYDSGKVANTFHSWPLAGEYAAAEGVDLWYRVKVWDGDNRESGWSDGVRFMYLPLADLEITNPPPSPDNIVAETTPPIAWTFSGTQKRVRLRLLEVKPSGKTREIFEFPRKATSITSITIPRGNIKSGKSYRVQLWVWDDVHRESVPNARSSAYAQRDFTYDRDGTPDPPDTLDATLFGPGVVLDWTRTLEPDYFCLVVDGEEVLDRIDPDDVRTGLGTYSLTYWRLEPRAAHEIELEAVVTVGGKKAHSSGNPTVSVTTDPDSIWIVDEDENQAVRLLGTEDATLTIGESGTTNYLVGGRRPVRIVDAIRGYEGGYSGEVFTAAARDAMLSIKGRPFAAVRAIAANLNLPVELEELDVNPMPTAGEPDHYRIAFSMFQSDEFFEIEGE